MNRYSRLDNQAPVVDSMEANNVNVGRSAHDCSHIHNGNTLIGALTPVLCMEVVLNEDIDINLASLIEFRNPTTRQLFNSFRVYFHGYFNSLTDSWEGAKNWLDKGRSGKIDLGRPNLIYKATYSDGDDTVIANACTPMSLLNFLGLPVEAYQESVTDSDGNTVNRPPLRQFQCSFDSTSDLKVFKFDKVGESTDYFPADCAFVYQKNWRDFYANKNLLQNNKFWFPDNEDHFILSYSCENAVCINYENEALSTDFDLIDNLTGGQITNDFLENLNLTPEPNNPATNTPREELNSIIYSPNLSGLKFRQFRGDRFTTGSPFPDLIRGELPTLQLTEDNYIRSLVTRNTVTPSEVGKTFSIDGSSSKSYSDIGMGLHLSSITDSSDQIRFGLVTPESSVTMSDIYTLETLTAFKRKMGMTNGDYSEMMEAQFGVKPKVHNRRGIYIGGFYQDFAFSSVTQTSQSTSDGTPLGTKAGQGISSGSGRIGHIHTTDFGWIQVYMSIMPDVYYTQGKPRQFSKRSNLEMYFPIFNNLPAQAIRNDELFISGNSTIDSSPFGYEDRYAEFKSIQNRVSGLMGLPLGMAEFDTARVIARRFTSTPTLNSLFVTAVPENIDMSVFSVYDEPPFDFSIGFSIRRVFPGPYAAIEGSLSSPKLNA